MYVQFAVYSCCTSVQLYLALLTLDITLALLISKWLVLSTQRKL